MTDKEIKELQDAVFTRCRLGCDEYHAHSATRGCISGSESDVATLKLCEHTLSLRAKVREVFDIAGE